MHEIIKTHAGRLYKYIPLPFLQGFERVVWGFTVRGSWRPNITEIFWPQSYGRQRCLSRSLGLLNRNPGVHSAGCWLSLLYLISNFSGPQTPLGFPKAPSAGCGFPYHNSSNSASNSTAWHLSWLSYIIVQRPLDRPRDLWNRMFNRHQAEITVMQFRGHSLPVRQSMRV